ncbi:MAG: 3-deoxy-D-manno-octulosonic acid transferase, partial [Limnohabitans sp.]|nr:3-deoxy-D-manno-octulosonic acid transferase [Limnohabitans sp.]
MKNISFGYCLRLYLWLSKECEWLWEKALQKRLAQGKETQSSLLQKWGDNNQHRPSGRLIWGHAVGVGEAMALAGLLKRIGEQLPDVHFLITTTARTSGEALQANGLPDRCIHQFAPIDTPRAVDAFLNHWQPSLAIWCEMDLWPTLITSTYIKNIPCVLVNTRVTQKSANKRRWAKYLYQDLLSFFQAIWAQNLETKKSLLQLGAIEQRIQITGTLKALSPPLQCNESIVIDWKKSLHDRPIWLLASSHLEDERVAIEAHQKLLKNHPSALLIIAPRERLRGEEILKNIGAKCQRRTQHLNPPAHDISFYVADTIGEMGLWFRLTPIALMGGSI